MSDAEDLQPGRVTSLKAQVKTPGRVSVFIDDHFAFGVNRDVVLEFGLKKGLELSIRTQREILEREGHYRARSTALRYISYRDRSVQEIRRRLERSSYSESAIESTIDSLKASGLLNDDVYAIAYAEGRFRSGGYGPLRVRRDLRRKGLDDAAVNRAVDEVFSEEDELITTIRALGRRRWEKLTREEDDRKRRKKVHDYLIRRGFPYTEVLSVLDEICR